ncbi:hypothetical protein [Deinococcus hopiensis]|uniref:Uncharacterized protein n=1 Tax=Deinococcus hopiensis KR-140 TaxID=695939 RepID=A0A1W1V7E0_9DEIO|nr:hypothetical protein [Deinococcus hopiensis]SMB89278.1 hypothetical protein SAMN00790413_00346 [Deinococcus hopiensis KR-140]
MAHIHTVSWRETYPALMPPDFLEDMTGAARCMQNGSAPTHLEVGAEPYTLYAPKAAHGQGTGALLRGVVRGLYARGHRSGKSSRWPCRSRRPGTPGRGSSRSHEVGKTRVPLSSGGGPHEAQLVWSHLGPLLAEGC